MHIKQLSRERATPNGSTSQNQKTGDLYAESIHVDRLSIGYTLYHRVYRWLHYRADLDDGDGAQTHHSDPVGSHS